MSVVYETVLKNDRLQLMSDLTASLTVVASTGSPTAGQLVIGTSALSGATGVLVTIALLTVPFSISAAVATLNGVPLSAVASGTGTAALAEIRNNAGTTIASGLTVGTAGANINLASTAVVTGETVTISSGTITHG